MKRTKRIKTPGLIRISGERLAALRAFRPMQLAEFIAALRSFEQHRHAFAHLGKLELAAAAERAWLQDAIIVASVPSPDREGAHLKCLYLQGAIDGWVLASPQAGESVAGVGMIRAAIDIECDRWGLTVDSSKTTH